MLDIQADPRNHRTSQQKTGLTALTLKETESQTRRGLVLFIAAAITFELALIAFTKYQSIIQKINFFSEHTLFTQFSSAQIILIAITAVVNGVLIKKYRGITRSAVGWFSAAAFAIMLAFDEIFEFHELVSKYSGAALDFLGLPIKSSMWDIPLFFIYAGIGLWLWFSLKKEINQAPLAKGFIYLSELLLGLSVVFDIGLHRVVAVAWEDGFKLLGFLSILIAFLAVAVDQLRFKKSASSKA